MCRVLAARIAKLRELQTTRGRLLVLRRRVVPVLAGRALQGNDFAHDVVLLTWPATSAGKQLAWAHNSSLTRRDTGLDWPLLPNPELCNGKTSGQATLVLYDYLPSPTFLEGRDERFRWNDRQRTFVRSGRFARLGRRSHPKG